MAGYNRNFPDDISACIVVGGDINDPAPDRSGNMKFWDPCRHSWQGVQTDHLAYSPIMRSNHNSFPRPADPGAVFYCRSTQGSPYYVGVGGANHSINDGPQAGNLNLVGVGPSLDAAMREIKVRLKPDIPEGTEGGAQVRKMKEKGKYFHNVKKGLPAHGMWELTGTRLPQVKGIETAKQQAGNILGAAGLANLPGNFMSLGRMFSMFSNLNIASITQNFSPALNSAFRSISFLMTDVEQGGGGHYMTDSKVHEDTYMGNAMNLLSQSRSLNDLGNVMGRLQHDTSLFGLDKLPNITASIPTPFGNVTKTISALGAVSTVSPQAVLDQVASFGSFMSSAGSFPGVNIGQNLFGKSSGTMMEMAGRIPAVGSAKGLFEVISKGGIPTGMHNISLAGLGQAGKNPLLGSLLKKVTG